MVAVRAKSGHCAAERKTPKNRLMKMPSSVDLAPSLVAGREESGRGSRRGGVRELERPRGKTGSGVGVAAGFLGRRMEEVTKPLLEFLPSWGVAAGFLGRLLDTPIEDGCVVSKKNLEKGLRN